MEATFGDAKAICQSVGSKIATIASLNFYWNQIISSIVTKVRCFCPIHLIQIGCIPRIFQVLILVNQPRQKLCGITYDMSYLLKMINLREKYT